MPEFPSVDWFEAVRVSANGDSQFTSQGTVNCVMGAKVSDAAFAIKFEGFECTSVEAIPESELRDLDFYIDLSPTEWRELLDNIAANGGSDSAQTLNTLDYDAHRLHQSGNRARPRHLLSSTTSRCKLHASLRKRYLLIRITTVAR